MSSSFFLTDFLIGQRFETDTRSQSELFLESREKSTRLPSIQRWRHSDASTAGKYSEEYIVHYLLALSFHSEMR